MVRVRGAVWGEKHPQGDYHVHVDRLSEISSRRETSDESGVRVVIIVVGRLDRASRCERQYENQQRQAGSFDRMTAFFFRVHPCSSAAFFFFPNRKIRLWQGGSITGGLQSTLLIQQTT